MKAIAQIAVWWPNMEKEIEELISSFQRCAMQRSLLPLAPLHTYIAGHGLVITCNIFI